MIRVAAALVSLFVATPLPAFAEDVILQEPFDDSLSLDWQIENEDDANYSLSDRPGELTISTAMAWIYNSQNGDGKLPRNTFLLKEPIATEQDFEATLAVSDFQPEIHWQQIDVLFYQGLDCYLKLSAERSKADPKNIVALIHETDGSPTTSFKTEVEFDGPLWLRLNRVGETYSVHYSNDGDQFQTLGELEWEPDSAVDPLRIGFAAYDGPNESAPSIEIAVESFQLTLME